MKKILRALLVIATMLFLYKILAVLYNPQRIDYNEVIQVRKYAWLVGVAVAGALVFVEIKLHLATPKPCGQRQRRDDANFVILLVVAVVHPISGLVMPNVAEVFSPIFLVAALLEELDFFQAALNFLNKNLFMLESNYFLFTAFMVQQVIFSMVCYLLLGQWYGRWQAKKVSVVMC